MLRARVLNSTGRALRLNFSSDRPSLPSSIPSLAAGYLQKRLDRPRQSLNEFLPDVIRLPQPRNRQADVPLLNNELRHIFLRSVFGSHHTTDHINLSTAPNVIKSSESSEQQKPSLPIKPPPYVSHCVLPPAHSSEEPQLSNIEAENPVPTVTHIVVARVPQHALLQRQQQLAQAALESRNLISRAASMLRSTWNRLTNSSAEQTPSTAEPSTTTDTSPPNTSMVDLLPADFQSFAKSPELNFLRRTASVTQPAASKSRVSAASGSTPARDLTSGITSSHSSTVLTSEQLDLMSSAPSVPFLPPSRDRGLIQLASDHSCRYTGSTSSVTSLLSHIAMSLLNYRTLNTHFLSSSDVHDTAKLAFAVSAPTVVLLRSRFPTISQNSAENEWSRTHLWCIDAFPDTGIKPNQSLIDSGHSMEKQFTTEPPNLEIPDFTENFVEPATAHQPSSSSSSSASSSEYHHRRAPLSPNAQFTPTAPEPELSSRSDTLSSSSAAIPQRPAFGDDSFYPIDELSPEPFNYCQVRDFCLRSQLDAQEPLLPGSVVLFFLLCFSRASLSLSANARSSTSRLVLSCRSVTMSPMHTTTPRTNCCTVGVCFLLVQSHGHLSPTLSRIPFQSHQQVPLIPMRRSILI